MESKIKTWTEGEKKERKRINCDHKIENIAIYFVAKTKILLYWFFYIKLLLTISNGNKLLLKTS